MANVEIIVTDDIFAFSGSGWVSTGLYIRHDQFCFPGENWSDFTHPVLGIWKDSLLPARYWANHTFKLNFLDGPYYLNVFKDEAMNLTIQCINDRNDRKRVELEVTCGYFAFLEEFYKAIKIFIKVLYSNNLHEGRFSSVYRQSILSLHEISNILAQEQKRGLRP